MGKLDFSELIGQHVDLTVQQGEGDGGQASAEPNQTAAPASPVVVSKQDEKPKHDGKLTKAEEVKAGGVAGTTVWQYIKAGGIFSAIIVILLHIVSQGDNNVPYWWLTYWTAHPGNDPLNVGVYAALTGYVLFSFFSFVGADIFCYRSTLILCGIRELIYQSFTLRASTNIHNLMFRTIMRAPMAFFDATPLGRILNRFTADMDIIDYIFPDMSMQALHYGFQVLGVLALISAFLHYMPALLAPMSVMYFLTQYYYRNANRDIKRIDSASRSPLFQHITSTLQGLSILRAFRQEPRFTMTNQSRVDHTIRATLQMYIIQRWLGFCLDFITICLVFSTAALCVGLRDSVTPAQAGLAITYSMTLAGTFQWTVRTIADSEAQLTSVERILQYCNPELEDPSVQNKKIKKVYREDVFQ